MARGSSKPKRINFERIDPTHDPESVHQLIRELVRLHHTDVAEAKFGAAWRYGLKRDKDGHLVLGKCVKASDLAREYQDCDFVILLNAEAWRSLSTEQRRALVDHELTHADVSREKDGEIKYDDRGRPVFRIRKHDLEEFRSIVARHGCYKADIEAFVQEALLSPKPPTPSLLDGIKEEPAKAEVEPEHVTCESCGIVRPSTEATCPVCTAPEKKPTGKRKKSLSR